MIQPARTSEQVKAGIKERFGFFTLFFSPALETPEVLENLWQQTLSPYVNNPLQALFKKKLLERLSRYCIVPYSIVCHSCALESLSMTIAEVRALLKNPGQNSGGQNSLTLKRSPKGEGFTGENGNDIRNGGTPKG